MSSIIDVKVLGDGGIQISHMRFTVDYGDDQANVVVILEGVDGLTEDVGNSFLELSDITGSSVLHRGEGGYDA